MTDRSGMREWLVVESSYKNAVFAPDDSKIPKGYIPRDVAEKLLGKDLGGMVWFTREESAKIREHPDWRETLPSSSAERFKTSHQPRMSAPGERDPSVMPDCRSAETPPVPDDVRSALADARAKIARWPIPNLVTQTNERHEAIASRDGLLKQIDAALRSAPVSAPADSGLIDRLLHGSDDHQTSMVLRKEAARILSAPAVGVTREAITLLAERHLGIWVKETAPHLKIVPTAARQDIRDFVDELMALLRSPAPDATVSEPVAWQPGQFIKTRAENLLDAELTSDPAQPTVAAIRAITVALRGELMCIDALRAVWNDWIIANDESDADEYEIKDVSPETVQQVQKALRGRLYAPPVSARDAVIEGDLCEDCPPVGYVTDITRCMPCPRRRSLTGAKQ